MEVDKECVEYLEELVGGGVVLTKELESLMELWGNSVNYEVFNI